MPTYEYLCDSCGYTFEVFRKMTDIPVSGCPQCGMGVHQVFSVGFGLNFNGKGFYASDTRKKDGAATAKKEQTEQRSDHLCGCGCSCSP